jgi:hypothetical protein
MRSYRLRRRSFLAGLGAATGLKILLGNLEASAQGTPSPPRFLLTHWPVGTIKYNFVPTGSRTSWTPSRILQPFVDAGLQQDMTVLYGLTGGQIGGPGGGHEKGTPLATTGATTLGTRAGQRETDDAIAGGPSFDQIFLKNVPELYRPNSGKGYANAICDSRVDVLEVSTQCLSYSYETSPVASVQNGTIQENTPLLPTLSPLDLYAELFSGFAGGGGADTETIKRAVIARKSVLDFSLRELAQMKTLAPSSAWPNIDQHAAAVRAIEQQLAAQIESGLFTLQGCTLPTQPAASDVGQGGDGRLNYDYGDPATQVADDVVHEKVGQLHFGIIQAAFQCDIIRAATFQWSPGTNHVSFGGLYPGEPNSIYMFHPLSHRITDRQWSLDATTVPATQEANVEFVTQCYIWYNKRMAQLLSQFKQATDAMGNSLLDYTIIPYVTEVAESAHSRSPMPAMIFGGKALGMLGGQWVDLESRPRSHNDLWLTIAQAYFKTTNPIENLQAEIFAQQGRFSGPIEGLWQAPT